MSEFSFWPSGCSAVLPALFDGRALTDPSTESTKRSALASSLAAATRSVDPGRTSPMAITSGGTASNGDGRRPMRGPRSAPCWRYTPKNGLKALA